MALTSFYLYPTGVFDTLGGRIASSNAANVDDPEPITAHDSVSTYDAFYGFSGSTVAGGITYGLGAPPSGMTINKIRVYAASFISNAGPDAFATDPEVTVCVRPAGSSTYYTAAATLVGGTASISGTSAGRITGLGFYNRNTASWTSGESPGLAYWEWGTNPATGAAWTLSDLANLKVGYFCDGSKGTPYTGANVPISSNLSYVAATALWVWVEAQTVAASIEGERAKGSQFLRMFRKPVRKVRLVVPVEFADLDVGDTFVMDHDQGPHPSGEGWGKKDWQRRELIVLSTSLNPTQRQVELLAMDARDFRCGLWSPLVTDIGFSEDGNGIPILHQGHGLVVPSTDGWRSTTSYVKKQRNDWTYAACGAGKAFWTPSGLYVDNGYRFQALLNSTFSQGSGSTFTNWTNTTTGGGAVAEEDGTNFLIDADGLRRGAKLSTSSAGTAYVTQTTGTIGGTGWVGRVRVHYNRLAWATSGGLYWRLKRNDTSQWWNDSTASWGSDAWNVIEDLGALGYGRFVSKMITLPVSTTYLLDVGMFNSNNGASIVLGEAQFLYTDTSSAGATLAPEDAPIYPTTTAASGPVRDNIYFPISRQELREDRGTLFLQWIPSFDHDDLPDGGAKTIWTFSKNGGLEWMRAYYVRSSSTVAYVYFQRSVAVATSSLNTVYSAIVTLSDSMTRAARGRKMGLAFRWTSASDELDLGVRQMKAYVLPNVAATSGAAATVVSGTATYADFTSHGITASDLSGMISIYGNSLRKGSGSSAWDSGFSTKTQGQSITGYGGGVAFFPKPRLSWVASQFMIGTDSAFPASGYSYSYIAHALYYNNDGSTIDRFEVWENGTNRATGGATSWQNGTHWHSGFLGRVQFEDVSGNVRARYYVNEASAWASSTASVTFPQYVCGSFYAPTNSEVWGIALYGIAISGTWSDLTIEPSRLTFGPTYGWHPDVDVHSGGGGHYQHIECVPYVLTDEEVERRMRG